MLQIVPDAMYEKLLCSQCSKYLSVYPIKVYEGGVMKCGRCCSYNDGGTISLYSMITENFYFKCINRYEGCRQLLKPSEVYNHEQSCVSGKYDCPECHSYNGSAYEIIQHFKNSHSSRLVSDNGSIKIDIVARDLDHPVHRNYLMVKEDIVCIILSRLNEYRFEFSLVLLKDYPNITYNCKIFTDGESNKTKTWLGNNCVSLENFQGDYCIFEDNFNTVSFIRLFPKLCIKTFDYVYSIPGIVDKLQNVGVEELETKIEENSVDEIDLNIGRRKPVKLTNEFKKRFPGYKLSSCGTSLIGPNKEELNLLCVNCYKYYGITMFNCSKRHLLCRECNRFCSVCDMRTFVNENVLRTHYRYYTEKLMFLLYPCQWPFCNKYVTGFNKMEHERECESAFLKCPTCSDILSLPKMKLHISAYHGSNLIELPVQDFTLHISKSENETVYFIKNCHLICATLKYKFADIQRWCFTIPSGISLHDNDKFSFVILLKSNIFHESLASHLFFDNNIVIEFLVDTFSVSRRPLIIVYGRN